MFNKLKQALGRVLGGNESNLIEATFNPVAADDRSLPRDVATYVATGEPSSVLARITAVPDIAGKVGIHCGRSYSMDASKYAVHRQMIAEFGNWEAPELLRLAQVYFAASKATAAPASRLTVAAWQGGYEWLELFIRQATDSPSNVWTAKKKAAPPVSLKTIEAMVLANGQDPAQIARGALLVDTTSYSWGSFAHIFNSFPDYSDHLVRHAAIVREAFGHADFKVKIHALESIAIAHASPLVWREEIGAFMVASSKQVRQAAEPLVRSVPDEFRPLLEQYATSGDNETRALAVQACHRVYGDGAREFLTGRHKEEKAKKVIAILDDILRIAEVSTGNEGTTDEWNLPPIPAIQTEAPLDDDVRADLEACLTKAYAEALAAYERIKHQKWAGTFGAVSPNELLKPIMAELQHGSGKSDRKSDVPLWRAWRDGTNRIMDFAGHPKFNLVHLVRWCVIWAGVPKERYWFHHTGRCFAAYSKINGPLSLREIAAVFSALGLDSGQIGRECLSQWQYGQIALFRQPSEGMWPYFAENLHLLEEAMGAVITEPSGGYMARYQERYQRQNALTVLGHFPRTPKRLLPLLWETALSGAKVERQTAQVALAKEPDTNVRLISSLSSGQMEVRAEAAGWLARLKAKDAQKPLLAALKKEKKEVAQSAMMLALESFGVPISDLVDRPSLEAEAEKQADKEPPADLAWFPFKTMPAVRWTDNGVAVPQNLLKLLLLQSFKLKNPEPGPLLRTYASFFSVEDRALLGRFIIDAWIAQDTIPAHTSDEAAKLAEAQTKQMAQHYKQYPQYAADWDEQKHYRAVYNNLITACKGSAVASKGILAVAGACANGTVAPVVHRYTKQYYGMRSAQCKALLQALAWIDNPNAIQVLLAIGNRFRTKGIQEEASRLCQELADRKSWTLDELADRTIPTAGLDEDGVLELDFGARSFTAKLAADFTLTLANGDGKELSTLPDANKSDDEEKAKAAKQQLSASRKELKTILKLQAERLYEGMCTQRTWIFADFKRHILHHPIVGRLCEQLVWSTVEEKNQAKTFRPLSDKTLTNTDDETVEIGDGARIRLAHEVTVPPAQRDAWIAHLADYKVEPLFQQFGKPTYTVADDRREETELNDFKGHVVESFKLRGRLTKLGYTRGQPQDGGWFMEYNKRFPGLGIQATVNFSGSPLPEENRPVALLNLSFSRISDEIVFVGETGSTRLGDLPAVLVSECWNDIRSAATDGKGFDPNWEKTVQY